MFWLPHCKWVDENDSFFAIAWNCQIFLEKGSLRKLQVYTWICGGQFYKDPARFFDRHEVGEDRVNYRLRWVIVSGRAVLPPVWPGEMASSGAEYPSG